MIRCKKPLCLLLALVLVLSGCGAKEPVVTEPEATQQEQEQQSYSFSLGSKIPELSITTAKAETLSIYDLLKQKKMVVLNFWFADCIWCIREFPVMEAAYQSYQQDAEIIALSPFDSKESIVTFQEELSLSFPMASCSRDLVMGFGIGSYPTSVVIDREGRICLIHSGAITESQVFHKLFQTFTAEDYTPRVYQSIHELL